MFEDIAPDSPDFHFVTRSQILDGSAPPEQLILTRNTHNKIAKVLKVPELGGEVERAIWQVTQQMREQQEQKSKQKSKQKSQQESQQQSQQEMQKQPPHRPVSKDKTRQVGDTDKKK